MMQFARSKFVYIVIAILALYFPLKGVFAKNITINNFSPVQFGQASGAVAACDPDGIEISLREVYEINPSNNESEFFLSGISISDIADSCYEKLFTISMTDKSNNTIPDLAAKTGTPGMSHVDFILLGSDGVVRANYPTAFNAVDYTLDTSQSSGPNKNQVEIELDFHHFVPASSIDSIGIEISEASSVDKSSNVSLKLNCGLGSKVIGYSRRIDPTDSNVVKSEILDIPTECQGRWIKVEILDDSRSKIIINGLYSRITDGSGNAVMDACNRQSLGSTTEISFYLPEQNTQPLVSGNNNSYSLFGIRHSNGKSEVLLDFTPASSRNALIGAPIFSSTPAQCVKDPNLAYYYPGY